MDQNIPSELPCYTISKEWRTEKIAMAETKQCVGCGQAFQVNEHGDLVVPFFDMHSTTCKKCSQPLKIEYKEDGSIHYNCPGHIRGLASSKLYGHSSTYCPYCYQKHRNERSIPCCVCQQKKGPASNTYQGYHLWRSEEHTSE